MSVTQTLGALGSWDLELAEDTPDYVLAQLGYFGHVAIVDGPVDVVAAGNGLLAGARYVGVCRKKGKPGSYTRGGSGLLFWLGDEDGKGHVILTEINLTNATLAQAVTALLPPTVTLGTVYPQADPAARYTGKHLFQSRRDALGIVADAFGAELRVNADFTVDVGTPAQLYDTTLPLTSKPSPIIVRRGAGSDVDMVAVGGHVETEGAVYDYSTDIQLLGQTVGTGTDPGTVFATGSASAPSVPYKDPQGNPVKSVRLISESGETQGSVAARAGLQLNRFNRETTAVKVTAEDFETEGSFSVGDSTYVYDPDSGIVNPANQVFFHGQVLNPDAVRVSSMTWPLVEGQTVAWRTDAGVWIDLTPWVVWESAGQHELTVGDLPKTLTRPSSVVQDRVDAARGDASIPKPPTAVSLATSSAVNPKGTDSAIITVSWTAPTQNTDNTALLDFDHYEVQYRPSFRAPLWLATAYTAGTSVDLPVVAALGYDVQVRTVDKAGNGSAWTAVASIVSAADSTAPAAPSDPVITPYLGILRVYWDGKTNAGGAMPSDFNRVDVHMGTTAGFAASAATLVSSLSAAGYAHVQAPYGSARYARLIAYDHNGNPSAASGTVSGTAVQAGDGDIAALSVGKLAAGTMAADVVMAGRFTTALTGQRREMNAVGWQAFDASNALTVNIDGVSNLLTGIFKTALAGRRIEIGAAGATGEINLFAPDGTMAQIRAWTEPSGVEAIQFGIPVAGVASTLWNRINYNSSGDGEYATYRAGTHEFLFDYSAAQKSGANTGVGRFVVFSTADRGATSGQRLQINKDTLTLYNTHYIYRDETQRLVYWYDGAAWRHRWYTYPAATGANQGFMELTSADIPTSSARLKLLTSQFQGNGLVWGGMIKYIINGDLTGQRFEFLNSDNTALIPLWASAFTVGSDEARKENIRPVGADPLSVVRQMKPKMWDEKDFSANETEFEDDKGNKWKVRSGKPSKNRIGLVAQEAPPEIVADTGQPGGKGIDLYAMTTVTAGAVVQVADKVDELAAVVETLRKKAA